jgi:hypothetical protein
MSRQPYYTTPPLAEQLSRLVEQGFSVYPKYPYCTLASMREVPTVEDEKHAFRVNRKALGADGCFLTLIEERPYNFNGYLQICKARSEPHC